MIKVLLEIQLADHVAVAPLTLPPEWFPTFDKTIVQIPRDFLRVDPHGDDFIFRLISVKHGECTCCASTGICGCITYGTGKLDFNGFWEVRCPHGSEIHTCANAESSVPHTPGCEYLATPGDAPCTCGAFKY